MAGIDESPCRTSCENFTPPEVPLDADGFVLSFSLPGQSAEYLEFFEKFGFAVANGVLTEDECDETVAEFWAEQAAGAKDDASTWDQIWSKQRFGHLGIIGLGPEFSPCQIKNRQNPKVYETFSTVLRTRELFSDHDRLGIMRPTVAVEIEGSVINKADSVSPCKFKLSTTDCNPVHGYASIGGFADDRSEIDFTKTLIIQSLLTLSDARAEDGGFHCVPGGHKICFEWAELHQGVHSSGRNMQVLSDHCPLCARLHSAIHKIPIRKGCHLCWTSLLFHGNHPNRSTNFRCCQYLRAMPIRGTPYSPLCPNRDFYPKDVEISDLGCKLFGFTRWE